MPLENDTSVPVLSGWARVQNPMRTRLIASFHVFMLEFNAFLHSCSHPCLSFPLFFFFNNVLHAVVIHLKTHIYTVSIKKGSRIKWHVIILLAGNNQRSITITISHCFHHLFIWNYANDRTKPASWNLSPSPSSTSSSQTFWLSE